MLSDIVQKAELFDDLSGSLCILKIDTLTRKILYTSTPLEELFGYTMQGQLIGEEMEVLLPYEKRLAHVEHLEQYAQDPIPRAMGTSSMKLEGQRKDGSRFPVEVALTKSIKRGNQITTTAIIIDMSRRNV